jgi:signal transduction histidine kinase
MSADPKSLKPPAISAAPPVHKRRVVHATRTSTFRYAALVAALVVISGLVIIGFSYVLAAIWERQQQASAQQEFSDLLGIYRDNGLEALVTEVRDRSAHVSRTGFWERLVQAEHIYALAPQHSERTIAGSLPAWPTGVAELSPEQIAFSAPRTGFHASELHEIRATVTTLPDGMRLLVGRDVDLAERLALWLEGALVWLFVFGLLSGTLGGWVASRRMLGRIEDVRESAERIMAGTISHRMYVSGKDDEFDRLAATLNRMLAEIEGLMRTVRRVTDDIAHDLRSPLTRIRQQLDLAQQEQDPEAARERVAESMMDIDRVLSTFNAMLTIATADSGSLRVDFESVPVDGLLQDLEELYRPMSEDRQQKLVVARSTELKVRANRQLLFQALANLTENAIKYAPEGGRIEIAATRRPDSIEVVVADNGPGIPEKDRERVLEPFVRLDQSRTEPGNGLGLALVAAISKLHRARLILGDNRPGLRVSLLIPYADRTERPVATSA